MFQMLKFHKDVPLNILCLLKIHQYETKHQYALFHLVIQSINKITRMFRQHKFRQSKKQRQSRNSRILSLSYFHRHHYVINFSALTVTVTHIHCAKQISHNSFLLSVVIVAAEPNRKKNDFSFL